MLAVALRDMQWGATDVGSVSQCRARSATAGGANDQSGAAVRVCGECDLPTLSLKRDDLPLRPVGAALSSVAVRVPGRVERHRGYREA